MYYSRNHDLIIHHTNSVTGSEFRQDENYFRCIVNAPNIDKVLRSRKMRLLIMHEGSTRLLAYFARPTVSTMDFDWHNGLDLRIVLQVTVNR